MKHETHLGSKLDALLKTLQQSTSEPEAKHLLTDTVAQLRATLEPLETVAPIRTIHHFACTGGTVISRFLAATPNARLLSEVDPLSPLAKGQFNPLDLSLLYRDAHPTVRAQDQIAIFLAGLQVIYARVQAQGERLILRDHSHSHFCTGRVIPERPTLKQIIAPHYPVLSVVTVRHPLDSYLSMLHNKFAHFTPHALEDYAARYMAFLDNYADEQIVKYEDFITDHTTTMAIFCSLLDLPNSSDLQNIAPGISLTGDSGRSGIALKLRERRDVPKDIHGMCERSTTYQDLCHRLDYTP
ncbi:hypothetical protein ROG8370_03514 [Roseovarius gaetbuli]|uniref:Sulfotransferase family protein n=1 Tax=Roseovarius gaetbuli TaxID=1356575 RepID=A0A1X7A7L3_9RHOB|nr:hypothetical protein [Roseovarius gaetbuli]SLN72470.1 hypothetical protein ROG8370_03514 [Roseovarius gaetbuli]